MAVRNPDATGLSSIVDPLALDVIVSTSGAHGAYVKVGKIGGSEVVLRIERTTHDLELPDVNDYAVYLDVRDENGEWRRLHRSELAQRAGLLVPPAIRKHE